MRFVGKIAVAVTLSFQLEFEVAFGLNDIQILRLFPLYGVGLAQNQW